MKAPDKKYPLSVLDDLRASTLHFMSDKIYFDGVEYIRKDALMEWAKGEIMPGNSAEGKGWNMAMQTLIEKIESL